MTPEEELEQAKQNYRAATEHVELLSARLDGARASVAAAYSIVEEAKRRVAAAIPVDRSAQQLTSGAPVPEDRSHAALTGSGMQRDYVVLSPEERAKGFVRPYRDAYRHAKCGHITTMGRSIAETYARDPKFYNGTFCSTCRQHFPIGEHGEFTWYEMDGREGPKVGT